MNANTPRILVVDDEPDIRRLVCEILEDEGYQVAMAENASAARELKSPKNPTSSCWISGCLILMALPY